MNIVDQLVKDSILGYFTIFPTRMHVFKHCLLGNGTGFEWVEKEDGLLYLEHWEDGGNDETIPSSELRREYKGEFAAKANELENMLRDWIRDNIDTYCQKDFDFDHLDFLPKSTYYLLSRGYNRLCDIKSNEHMAKVAPEWQDAILETCNYYMELIAKQNGGSPYMDCRDQLKGDAREQYLLLELARNKVLAQPKHQKNKDVMAKISQNIIDKLGREDGLPTKEERIQKQYEDFKHNFTSYEAFMEIRKQCIEYARFPDDIEVRAYLRDYVKSTIKYFREGKPNEEFYKDFKICLEHASWRWFSEYSVLDTVMRGMDISFIYRPLISKMVADEICTCVGS